MMNKRHSEVLEYINCSNKVVGIIPTLLNGGLCSANYFIESNYKDVSGKTNQCYLVTRMGCELLGTKQQGEKGILFTAKYVERFNIMEIAIKENNIIIANKEIEELKDTVNELKKVTEEAKKHYKPSHKTKLDYSKLIRTLI